MGGKGRVEGAFVTSDLLFQTKEDLPKWSLFSQRKKAKKKVASCYPC